MVTLSASLMMFTPTAGVLAAWLFTRTPARQWLRETGLTLGGHKGRTALLVLAAWLGVPLLVASRWRSASRWGCCGWTWTD